MLVFYEVQEYLWRSTYKLIFAFVIVDPCLPMLPRSLYLLAYVVSYSELTGQVRGRIERLGQAYPSSVALAGTGGAG